VTKHAVKAPVELMPLFSRAEQQFKALFSKYTTDKNTGTIEIAGERYVLVRSASLAYDFFDSLVNLYAEKGLEESIAFARTFLFDFAHSMGKKDAEHYKKVLKLNEPMDILSAGPVHFSYTGWAFVDIFPESTPTPDQNYFLLYDHLFSFESDSWLRLGKKAEIPICIMNAGYSSGWCEASFNMPLVAVEIMCKAMGDECCRFIMAPPDKINSHAKKYLAQLHILTKKKLNFNIPLFYEIAKYQKKIDDAERKLKESEEKFRVISSHAKEAIILMDKLGVIVFWNKAAEKIFEFTDDEVLGKNLHEVIAPAKYKSIYADELPFLFSPTDDAVIDKVFTLEALTKSCQIIPIELSVSSVFIGGMWHAVAIIHDIKERRLTENKLLREKAALNATNEAITILDVQGNIIDINTAFTLITGYNEVEILGENISVLYSDKEDAEFYSSIWHSVLSTEQWVGELWFQNKSGEYYATRLSINSIKNCIGDVHLYVAVFSDITLRKNAELKTQYLASHDPLTSIANRELFLRVINDTLIQCAVNNKKAALLYIDVDFFKEVNDTYGHTSGDEVLQEIAVRLKKCIRATDIVARLGGDEFAVLLHEIESHDQIILVAQKILKLMSKSFAISEHTVHVHISASIGIAIYPDDAESADQLIKYSDEAMYRVKNSQRNGYDFFGIGY
jgi:diguanylate cyclase (GGDEF)-like protein/PAS domain S-box-containing protein